MCTAQNTLDLKVFLQIVACQHKLCGFASRDETTVVRNFDTAKFWEIATFREVFRYDMAEKASLNVRR
jgi:hypothetical protein